MALSCVGAKMHKFEAPKLLVGVSKVQTPITANDAPAVAVAIW